MRRKGSIRGLLIANRSEIAIRGFRAASELGIQTVAIFAEEDKLSLHRFKADEAYRVGKGKGPLEAYLSIDDVLAVARKPAPPPASRSAAPDTMRKLGNKVAARNVAMSVDVPVMPATGSLPCELDEIKARRCHWLSGDA